MGCDIHGVWELMLPNGTWVAFKEINLGQNYDWFGVLSGVRTYGPCCDAMPWDPRDADDDPEVIGRYWRGVCERWPDLHNHTLASAEAIMQANDEWRTRQIEYVEEPTEHDVITNWEPIPSPDDEVESLMFGIDAEVPMRVPLREILGIPDNVNGHDPRFLDRIRFVCAYDS